MQRNANRGRVTLIQTAIGDYRSEFIKCLRSSLGERLEIVTGDVYFYDSLVTRLPEEARPVRARNLFLLGRRLLWQRGAFRRGVTAQVAVLELNPRIATVWLTVIARRLLGRRTVLWGHAWPRFGKGAKTDGIRRLLRSLADTLLVYTEQQAAELHQDGFRRRVVAAPNALYSRQQMRPVDNTRRIDFIYVGRLVSEKKVSLLVQAFLLFSRSSEGVRLHVVGDGPERASLQSMVFESGIEERVTFYGHESDPIRLSAIYNQCLAAVSPGYAGLSITQAFGFGVPMLIADDEPHAPEIEAARSGENAVFFQADSSEALCLAMRGMAREVDYWNRAADSISENCRNRYSAEVMAERFIRATDEVCDE